jgi:hypothetical protein
MQMTQSTEDRIRAARSESETKAWSALAGYKFEMFGYWASSWVKYNQLMIGSEKLANPFRDAVHLARKKQQDALDARGAA